MRNKSMHFYRSKNSIPYLIAFYSLVSHFYFTTKNVFCKGLSKIYFQEENKCLNEMVYPHKIQVHKRCGGWCPRQPVTMNYSHMIRWYVFVIGTSGRRPLQKRHSRLLFGNRSNAISITFPTNQRTNEKLLPNPFFVKSFFSGVWGDFFKKKYPHKNFIPEPRQRS